MLQVSTAWQLSCLSPKVLYRTHQILPVVLRVFECFEGNFSVAKATLQPQISIRPSVCYQNPLTEYNHYFHFTSIFTTTHTITHSIWHWHNITTLHHNITSKHHNITTLHHNITTLQHYIPYNITHNITTQYHHTTSQASSISSLTWATFKLFSFLFLFLF